MLNTPSLDAQSSHSSPQVTWAALTSYTFSSPLAGPQTWRLSSVRMALRPSPP